MIRSGFFAVCLTLFVVAYLTDRLMILGDATLFRFDHIGNYDFVDEIEQGR